VFPLRLFTIDPWLSNGVLFLNKWPVPGLDFPRLKGCLDELLPPGYLAFSSSFRRIRRYFAFFFLRFQGSSQVTSSVIVSGIFFFPVDAPFPRRGDEGLFYFWPLTLEPSPLPRLRRFFCVPFALVFFLAARCTVSQRNLLPVLRVSLCVFTLPSSSSFLLTDPFRSALLFFFDIRGFFFLRRCQSLPSFGSSLRPVFWSPFP